MSEPTGRGEAFDDQVLLRAEGVEVVFGETRVLNGASLSVASGEIHVLIGPNGAGKTTLANVITGHVKPTTGVIEFAGQPLKGASWRRVRRGIGRKFQVPRVFARLTSEENLGVALARRRAGGGRDEGMNFSASESVKAEALSHGWRQRLEMRMVLGQEPLIAVLDEPTAGMPKGERQELAEFLMTRRARITYLIVEHDMDFVESVADRVSFMHNGSILATGSFEEISHNPTVREIYLGVSADGISHVADR